MPLDTSDFPYEVQVAFFVYSLLADRWDGASGSFMGKDWTNIQSILDIYEVEEPKVVVYFTKMIENEYISYRAEEAQKKRKAEERKAQMSGGKNFTHNVKG